MHDENAVRGSVQAVTPWSCLQNI